MQELTIIIFMMISVVAIFALTVFLVFRIMEVVGPDELLILYGMGRPAADDGPGLAKGISGKNRGYTIITEGRVVTAPPLEGVARMDVSPIEMTWELPDTRTRGGDRISVRASATVVVDMTPETVENFVECFIERPHDEVVDAAKKTLESQIRSIASAVDVEDFSTRLDEVATRTVEVATSDLEKLGLKVEALTLEHTL